MCLRTQLAKPFILEQDLVVYKGLTLQLASPSKHFQYEIGKEYTAEIKEVDDTAGFSNVDDRLLKALGYNPYGLSTQGNWRSIGPGIHAHLHKEVLFGLIGYCPVVVKCYIPAGSEVYLDFTGVVVTNHIVLENIITPNDNG